MRGCRGHMQGWSSLGGTCCRAGCSAHKERGILEDIGEGRPRQREQPGGMGPSSACVPTHCEEVSESEGWRGSPEGQRTG